MTEAPQKANDRRLTWWAQLLTSKDTDGRTACAFRAHRGAVVVTAKIAAAQAHYWSVLKPVDAIADKATDSRAG